MTEYGKALVAAACRGSAMPGETCCGAVDWCCERPPMVRAMLAAIDKLIEAGPSEAMLTAVTPKESDWIGHREASSETISRWIEAHRKHAAKDFTAMLRALRAEIDECAEVAEQWGDPQIADAIRDRKAPEV